MLDKYLSDRVLVLIFLLCVVALILTNHDDSAFCFGLGGLVVLFGKRLFEVNWKD